MGYARVSPGDQDLTAQRRGLTASGAPRRIPKLNVRQQQRLTALLDSGEHSISDLADLFGVSRATVYPTAPECTPGPYAPRRRPSSRPTRPSPRHRVRPPTKRDRCGTAANAAGSHSGCVARSAGSPSRPLVSSTSWVRCGTGVNVELLIARNPDQDSSLPFVMRGRSRVD